MTLDRCLKETAMPRLLARLTDDFLCFARRHDGLLSLSRQHFEAAERIESSYARYDKPAYLRRRKIVGTAQGADRRTA